MDQPLMFQGPHSVMVYIMPYLYVIGPATYVPGTALCHGLYNAISVCHQIDKNDTDQWPGNCV